MASELSVKFSIGFEQRDPNMTECSRCEETIYSKRNVLTVTDEMGSKDLGLQVCTSCKEMLLEDLTE